MKALILCLSAPFTHGMLYKENCFIQAGIELGDTVTVIAACEEYKDGKLSKTAPGVFEMPGYKLIRLERAPILHPFISDKIRRYKGLEDLIISESPDLIFCNGPQFYNVKSFKRIKQALPNCRVVWGFSVHHGNSGRNKLSLNVLHRIIYRSWLNKSVRYADKIFVVGYETEKFITEVYKLPKEKIELNDLPGIVISRSDKEKARSSFREERNLDSDTVIFMHSGKMNKDKKTEEILSAFSKVNDPRFRLFIIGALSDDIKSNVMSLIDSDSRVSYVSFVLGKELEKYLAACDVYVQPGTVSQTYQNSICSGAAVIAHDCPNNRKLFDGNGWLISEADELESVFSEISKDVERIRKMSDRSLAIAQEKLDYKTLYGKMYI